MAAAFLCVFAMEKDEGKNRVEGVNTTVSTGMLIFSALVGINTDEITKSSANSIQLHSHKICLGKWSEHPTVRACPLAPQVPAWEVRKKGALCVATRQSLCVRRTPMVINGINLLESSPSTLPPFTLIPIYTSFLSSCSLTCDGWWGREGLLPQFEPLLLLNTLSILATSPPSTPAPS